MKKLFTLLLTVVTVAAFAAPALQKAKKQQPQMTDAKIEMNAQKAGLYTGKAGMTKDFTSGVDTMYLTPKGTFFSAYFPYVDPKSQKVSYFYCYNLGVLPTNVETTWSNISTGTATGNFDWAYYNPNLDEEYISLIEGEKDLVATFPNYPGWWISPRLYADAYAEDGPYFAFDGAVQYGGKWEDDVNGDGSVYTTMYQLSPRAEYNDIMTTSFGAGKGEDANSFYSDLPAPYKPEGATDGKIVSFMQRFEYPGKPYTFSHIQFYAKANVTAGQTITAKVCKINDGLIDAQNPIAEAVYEFPADDLGESTMSIDFYFEKYDPELGLTTEDWLTIDSDIAIYIEGVNELQDISPVMQALDYQVDRIAHDGEFDRFINGYGEWEFYDANGEIVDVLYIPCHLGYYWGSDEDSGLPQNLLLSINAQMAYIETADEGATTYTIPADATEATIELKASEPYDAWTVEDLPEWINIEAEDVMEQDEAGNVSYSGYTNLNITLEAGHEGSVVYTLPNTEFKIIIGDGGSVAIPGDVNGDGFVTSADVTAIYDVLLGTDMTFEATADVNGDGYVTSADVTAVYDILLGTAE